MNFKDPILGRPCRALTLDVINSSEMQAFFDEMLAFSRGDRATRIKHVLVGLAAPQVGRDVRVIIVDVLANGKGGVGDARLYINPEIIERSEETEEWYEGCYSTGQVKGIVVGQVKLRFGRRIATDMITRDPFRLYCAYFFSMKSIT